MTKDLESIPTIGAALPEPEMQGFRSSSRLDKIAPALAKAQAEQKQPVKNCTAKIPGRDGKQSFSYKYADLNAVVESIDVYAKHGIAVLQSARNEGRSVTITTLLLHESGQWIESCGLGMPVPDSNKPQVVASSTTFARRYDASLMLRIAADEDDEESLEQRTAEQDASDRSKRATPPKVAVVTPPPSYYTDDSFSEPEHIDEPPKSSASIDEWAFEKKWENHINWAHDWLAKQNVNVELWNDICDTMDGKPFGKFPDITKEMIKWHSKKKLQNQ